MQELPINVLKALDQFEQDWSTGDTSAFLALLRFINITVDAGSLDENEAARAIVATMFVSGVDNDPLRAEIVQVAGDLETGQPTATKHTWAHLLELVDELEASQEPQG